MSYSEKISFTDFSFEVMNNDQRVLDFALVAKCKQSFDLDTLKVGAQKAFECFPKSNCLIKRKTWIPCTDAWNLEVKKSSNLQEDINDFLARPIKLHRERGIKQLYLQTSEGDYLVTRMHHALADALSLLLWLKVQFSNKLIPSPRLELNSHPNPIKKSPFANKKASRVFGGHRGKVSNLRRLQSIALKKPSNDLREKGFSYNDLLCAIVFEAIRKYNLDKGISEHRNGIYLPVNIRKNPFAGFGNGSSRIKIYDQYAENTSYKEIAILLRKQVKTCREQGLWAIPEGLGPFEKLPKRLGGILLKLYAMLPSNDFGSLIFSHLERLKGIEDIFDPFSEILGVSQLYKAYPVNLSGVSFEEDTIMTATYDENIIKNEDMVKFLGFLKKEQEKAYNELNI